MWIRGWFPDGQKSHMRGYTLVDPDPAAGTVSVDFAMHDGLTTRWAQEAEPGEVLEVTVLGSNFALPEPRKNDGEALVEAVRSSAFDASDHFGWVACDNRATRAVSKIFREAYKIPRKSMKVQAYWNLSG